MIKIKKKKLIIVPGLGAQTKQNLLVWPIYQDILL